MLGPLSAERDTASRAALAEYVRQGAADGSIRADADRDAVAVVRAGLLRGIGMQLASTSGRSLDAAADRAAAPCDRGHKVEEGGRHGRPARDGA